jgi:hypothetical protein
MRRISGAFFLKSPKEKRHELPAVCFEEIPFRGYRRPLPRLLLVFRLGASAALHRFPALYHVDYPPHSSLVRDSKHL